MTPGGARSVRFGRALPGALTVLGGRHEAGAIGRDDAGVKPSRQRIAQASPKAADIRQSVFVAE